MRRTLACILAMALPIAAQQVGRNAPAGGAETPLFRSETQLVVQTVVVTGRDGKPVEGLSADDFVITEDGVPQPIRVFEYQQMPGDADGEKGNASPTDSREVRIYETLGRTRISVPPPGDGRYKNRRLLALYFDMTSMPPLDQLRALGAAQNFISTQMGAADLVAILRYSGAAVDVLQDFTADRNRLLSIVQTMMVGEGQGYGRSTDDAGTGEAGSAFGQNDAEFNVFNTDRQLSALQTAAKLLGQIPEKKALVYFASGLRLNGLNNQAQLLATINSAVRAGVSFWPIDARGLVAQAPLGDASQASPGGVGVYSGAAAMSANASLQRSQDTLYALASDTGGKALLDSNRLEQGIVQAQRSITNYYLIGYYSSNTAEDGKFRRIAVSLKNNPQAKLEYRQGYYAAKRFGQFSAAEKERQLEDALMLEDPITELTIAMEINYFQMNRAEYFVPVAVKIPGRELALAKRGGAEQTTIDFIGEIKNGAGTTVSNVRDRVTAKLSGATAQELAKRPIIYDTGFTLIPGRYTIKFLARDAETGRIGTFQTSFVVPNLNREENRVPISSVVLSSQWVDLDDALYNAGKQKDRNLAANPLVKDSRKRIPSVTRVFRNDRNLSIFLQAYERPAPGTDGAGSPAPPQPLVGFAALYQGQEKAIETAPVLFSARSPGRHSTIPLELEIPLQSLGAGEYECQITVIDPATKKATFWRSPILLTE